MERGLVVDMDMAPPRREGIPARSRSKEPPSGDGEGLRGFSNPKAALALARGRSKEPSGAAPSAPASSELAKHLVEDVGEPAAGEIEAATSLAASCS